MSAANLLGYGIFLVLGAIGMCGMARVLGWRETISMVLGVSFLGATIMIASYLVLS